MSKFSDTPSVAHQLSLVLHTAVDFGRNEGIDIGIIQSPATGETSASAPSTEEHKHGIERGQIRAENVKTRERAHMYALVLAMGLARSTIKRQCTTASIAMQSVTVLCRLPTVVKLIKYHRARGPKSVETLVSAEDRSMMKRVLASIKRLSRYNVQVSVVEDGAEGNAVDAARVKMIAHQRQKKACRRRCHARRIESMNAGRVDDKEEDETNVEDGDGVGDGEEIRSDSLYVGPMAERELLNIFMTDKTGERE